MLVFSDPAHGLALFHSKEMGPASQAENDVVCRQDYFGPHYDFFLLHYFLPIHIGLFRSGRKAPCLVAL